MHEKIFSQVKELIEFALIIITTFHLIGEFFQPFGE